MGRIDAPALVFGGRYDQVTPLDQAAELAKGLKNGQLVVMEHSAHFPFLEENYMFTQWVRQFILRTADGGGGVALVAAERAGGAPGAGGDRPA